MSQTVSRFCSAVRTVWWIKVFASAVPLAMLVVFQVVSQITTPGFMDNFEYILFQTASVLVLVVAAEIFLRNAGGLSWPARILAVCACYADHVGNDRYLYYAFPAYDKITHFLGVATITAGAYECLRALSPRSGGRRAMIGRLRMAVAAGLSVGIGWEFYELLGDIVLQSSRVHGWRDTSIDIVFDTLGALATTLTLLAGTGAGWRLAADRRSRRRGLSLYRRAIALMRPGLGWFDATLGSVIVGVLLAEQAPLASVPVVVFAGMASLAWVRLLTALRTRYWFGYARAATAS